MLAITHISALLLRLTYFILSTTGLCLLIVRSHKTPLHHCLILLSLLALFLSRALASGSVSELLLLFFVLLIISVIDIAFVKFAQDMDGNFLPVALLVGVGVVIAFDTMPNATVIHIRYVLIGCACCLVSFCIARRLGERLAATYTLLYTATIVLCILPVIPGLGLSVNGARSWVRVGPMTIQPSEFAKVTLALATAGYLIANSGRMAKLHSRGIIPLCCVLALAIGTEIITKEWGTAMVMFTLSASMLVFCNDRVGFVYGSVVVLLAVFILLIGYVSSAHIADRLNSWWLSLSKFFEEGRQYFEGGSQYDLAAKAIGNGGIIGTGLNFGSKLPDVPVVESDFVFSAVAEELGLIGVMQVLMAYVAFATQALHASRTHEQGRFTGNLLVGAVGVICVQAFVIIGGNVGLIPLTGVTLPFVSRGGSSIVALLVLVGLFGGLQSGPKITRNETPVAARRHVLALPSIVAVVMSLCFVWVIRDQPHIRLCGETKRQFKLGDIVTADGVVLATNKVNGDGVVSRSYPQGARAAHLISKLSGGVEACLDEQKLRASSDGLLNLLALPETSQEVRLTIDSRVQDKAESQLSGKTGAIVAISVRSGAILAEASSPTFDVGDAFDDSAKDGRYFNRAVSALYEPGSTFKVITMAAALEGGVSPNDKYSGNTFTLPDGRHIIRNYEGVNYGDYVTLTDSLKNSLNTAFASLALNLGGEAIYREAVAFGFNDGSLRGVPSSVGSTYYMTYDDYTLALAAVGQPQDAGRGTAGPNATVVEMCSVAATVANDGGQHEPYVVRSGPLPFVGPQGARQSLSTEHAGQLWLMMINSSGVSDSDKVSIGKDIIGKTGTAERNNIKTQEETRCWYICATRDVAVACCIEGGKNDLGREVAQPRALEVLRTAMASFAQ